MPVAGIDTVGIAVILPGPPADTVWGVCLDPDPAAQAACADPDNTRARATLADWRNCDTDGDGKPDGNCSDIGYYTFRGFKGALRASVDVGALLNHPKVRPNDFKVYGEVALLGFEDQPFYYEDKLARMPVMAGLNVPTFGLLDRLSAEVEYRKSKFQNSIYGMNRELNPVPVTDIDGAKAGYNYLGKENTNDDLRWSFYASRNLTEGVTLTGQVASDHMRHPDFWGVFGYQPATRNTKDWYYVVRLDFGMF
jgi:hypothetical protein